MAKVGKTFTPMKNGLSYKQQIAKMTEKPDYHRIVMLNAIKTTNKDGEEMVLAEFGLAMDKKDPATLVHEDANFGLKNSFRRDETGQPMAQMDENGQPIKVINAKGAEVDKLQTNSLQPISIEAYNKIITTAVQTPRLDKDGNPVMNKVKDADGKVIGETPIRYAVFEAPLRKVEKLVTDKNGSPVYNPSTGKAAQDLYYAPIMECARYFKQGADGKAARDADGKVIPLDAFDADAHWANVKTAKDMPANDGPKGPSVDGADYTPAELQNEGDSQQFE